MRDEFRRRLELSPRGPVKGLALAAVKEVETTNLYAEDQAFPWFEALARLLAGEDLIDAGRSAEGRARLAKALAAFLRLRWSDVLVQRGDRLLAEAQSASA